MRDIINLAILIRSSYDDNRYKSLTIGTSDCNDYIPVFAISSHKLIKFEDEDVNVMVYSMPLPNLSGSYSRTYLNLVRDLRTAPVPTRYLFKVAGIQHVLYVDRGMIYTEEGKILMCLAINKNYLFSVSKKQFLDEEIDVSNFILLLTEELDNPIYKNLKKKLEQNYIASIKSLNIDIVITKKIDSWLFKNNVKKIKFKNVTEMNKHLKQEVPMRILEM